MQAVQCFIHTLLPAPAVQRFNLTLQDIQVTDAIAVVIDQFHDRCQSALHRFKNAVVCVQHRLLCHISNAHALLHMHRAVVGMLHAGQNFEQRRFASAIAPNQANAFTGFKGKVCVM